jgi:hypothetical protein
MPSSVTRGAEGGRNRQPHSGQTFCVPTDRRSCYNLRMTPQLTDELRQAIADHHGEPVQVEDPVSHAQYMLVHLDAYRQLQRTMEYDASEPDPRSFYPAFAEAVKADLDAPGMELYDDDPGGRNQP